jgi:hypothetical protein
LETSPFADLPVSGYHHLLSATQTEALVETLNALSLNKLPEVKNIANNLEALDAGRRSQRDIETKCSWARLYPHPRTFDKSSMMTEVVRLGQTEAS